MKFIKYLLLVVVCLIGMQIFAGSVCVRADETSDLEETVEAGEHQLARFSQFWKRKGLTHQWEMGSLDQDPTVDQELVEEADVCEGLRFAASFFFSKVYECPVCFEAEVPVKNQLHLPCGHFVCKECAAHYYRGKIDEGAIELACLHPDCSKKLAKSILLSVLDREYVAKLRRNRLNRNIQTLPEGRFRPCHTLGCPGFFVRCSDVTDVNFTEDCSICHAHYCYRCHEAHNMEEHQSMQNRFKRWFQKNIYAASPPQDELENEKKEEIKNAKMMGYEIHRCPFCKAPASKDTACNHVTCQQCGREYNWKYERPWKGYEAEGRQAHF